MTETMACLHSCRVAQTGSYPLLVGTKLASVAKDQKSHNDLGGLMGVPATRDPPGLAGDRGCHSPQRGLEANRADPGRAGLLTPPGKKTCKPQADEIGPSPNVTSPAFLIWHEMSVASVLLSPLSLSLPSPSSLFSQFICVCIVCVYTCACMYEGLTMFSTIFITLSF